MCLLLEVVVAAGVAGVSAACGVSTSTESSSRNGVGVLGVDTLARLLLAFRFGGIANVGVIVMMVCLTLD